MRKPALPCRNMNTTSPGASIGSIKSNAWLTPRQVAERLQCTVRTVSRGIASGEIPSVKFLGLRRIPESALDRAIARGGFDNECTGSSATRRAAAPDKRRSTVCCGQRATAADNAAGVPRPSSDQKRGVNFLGSRRVDEAGKTKTAAMREHRDGQVENQTGGM